HQFGMRDLEVDQVFDSARQTAAVDFHVQLEIQAQTARVEVGGADQAPGAVDGRQFGMIEIAGGAPYPASRPHDLVQLCGHGVIDQTQVVLALNHDVHQYPAAGRRIDGTEQHLIRQEVRGLNADVVLRDCESAQQQAV